MTRFFTTTLLLAALTLFVGCASSGRKMDPGKLAQIKPGVTTKAEMMKWFGSPMSQTLDTNGKLVMMWYHNQVQSYVFHMDIKQQILSVLFDTKDVVEKFSLVDDINKARDIPSMPAQATP